MSRSGCWAQSLGGVKLDCVVVVCLRPHGDLGYTCVPGERTRGGHQGCAQSLALARRRDAQEADGGTILVAAKLDRNESYSLAVLLAPGDKHVVRRKLGHGIS